MHPPEQQPFWDATCAARNCRLLCRLFDCVLGGKLLERVSVRLRHWQQCAGLADPRIASVDAQHQAGTARGPQSPTVTIRHIVRPILSGDGQENLIVSLEMLCQSCLKLCSGRRCCQKFVAQMTPPLLGPRSRRMTHRIRHRSKSRTLGGRGTR